MEHGLDAKWLAQLMKQRYHNDKIVEVLDADVKAAVPKGENYTSTVLRVKLTAMTACGSKKTQSIIVKLDDKPKESQEVLGEFSTFKIETKMFSTILQQMEALMHEFGDKRDTLWPKYYGAVPYSIMALEDLTDSGYETVDRRNWQSLDHALLVLRNMGRLHAMSKVLLGRGLVGSDDKGHFFMGKDSPANRAVVTGGLYMLVKAMKNRIGSWTAGWEDLAERLDKQKHTLSKKIEELYGNYDKKFEILCHGDLWSSNMMFRHMEYTGIPTCVKFVDYQIGHINSFIWDVIYYMHTSVKPSVRRAHKSHLLKAYHQSLADNLKFFKYPGYVPTLDDVISEDKRLSPASAYFALVFLAVTSATTKDAFVMEKLLTGTPEETFHMDAFSEEKYVREVGGDIKEFAAANTI